MIQPLVQQSRMIIGIIIIASITGIILSFTTFDDWQPVFGFSLSFLILSMMLAYLNWKILLQTRKQIEVQYDDGFKLTVL